MNLKTVEALIGRVEPSAGYLSKDRGGTLCIGIPPAYVTFMFLKKLLSFLPSFFFFFSLFYGACFVLVAVVCVCVCVCVCVRARARVCVCEFDMFGFFGLVLVVFGSALLVQKTHTDPRHRISRNSSRSSQCSTTGVTKAVVCVILSVG